MKKFMIFLLASVVGYIVQAQDIKLPSSNDLKKAEQQVKTETDKVTSQANIGSLISQLTKGISDNSFTDTFKKNKGEFVQKVAGVKDAAGGASALQKLQGGLLPSAMESGWAKIKDKWLKDVKAAKTVKSVAAVAGTLESNISDKSFKGDWAKARPAWQAALSAMAK